MKARNFVMIMAALPLLAACADNNRYSDRNSGYYEQNSYNNSNTNTNADRTFRTTQSK